MHLSFGMQLKITYAWVYSDVQPKGSSKVHQMNRNTFISRSQHIMRRFAKYASCNLKDPINPKALVEMRHRCKLNIQLISTGRRQHTVRCVTRIGRLIVDE